MEKHHDVRRYRLLEDGPDDSDGTGFHPSPDRSLGPKTQPSGRLTTLSSVAILGLLIYIAALETIRMMSGVQEQAYTTAVHTGKDVDQTFSLFGDALTYEERPAWSPTVHPWDLPPSAELDVAWEKLLFALNIRISQEEMLLLHGNTTNAIRVHGEERGGDYLAGLGVHHLLHCLNALRKTVHSDYYYLASAERDQGPESIFGKTHLDHCIDGLRQMVMCYGNTELWVGEWLADSHEPYSRRAKYPEGEHTTCLNWDSLEAWAKDRVLVKGEFKYYPGPFEKNH